MEDWGLREALRSWVILFWVWAWVQVLAEQEFPRLVRAPARERLGAPAELRAGAGEREELGEVEFWVFDFGWGVQGSRGQGGESRGPQSPPAEPLVVSGRWKREAPKAGSVRRGCRRPSKRCAEGGAPADSPGLVRQIREVEASAGGADGLQGAKNGFIGHGGVGPERDDQFGVGGLAAMKRAGQLVEGHRLLPE